MTVHSVSPVPTVPRLGVQVGADSAAHRVASYNPFVALQWMLDGKTSGPSARGPAALAEHRGRDAAAT